MPDNPVSYPQGIVTFLFTDIVGSNSGRSRPAVSALQPATATAAVCRNQKACGGTQRTHFRYACGDSIMAAFANVNDALDCAIAIQNILPTITHKDTNGKEWTLAARIGVHTSEMQVMPNKQGEYLNHPDVIYAARIMSVAHGGQIVLSGNGHKQCEAMRWNWQEWKKMFPFCCYWTTTRR